MLLPDLGAVWRPRSYRSCHGLRRFPHDPV